MLAKIYKKKPGLGKQRLSYLCEFQASLVDIMSSGHLGSVKKHVSKKTKTKTKTKDLEKCYP
jgi:regulator of sigma D